MKQTSVTISARGAPGSGKSTLLNVINELLHGHVRTVESIYSPSKHSTQFLLPANFAKLAKESSDVAAGTINLIGHQREVIEKWNAIDKANTERIAALEKQIDLVNREHAAACNGRQRAEAERDGAVNEISELKARLHEAETQLARMRGYVDRVHDLDEIGREPLTTVTERTERPRRRDRVDMALTNNGCASNGERRRHWTSYGQ